MENTSTKDNRQQITLLENCQRPFTRGMLAQLQASVQAVLCGKGWTRDISSGGHAWR